MSVKKAKEHCGYQQKPALKTCGNCGAFASDFDYPAWCKNQGERNRYDLAGYAKVEKNMRCTDHGFAVKKMAACNLWRQKDGGALPVQPVSDEIAAQFERTDWTPEEALRFYAEGKNFDIVAGHARIIDNGAVASNALKHLSLSYSDMKGDVAVHDLREQRDMLLNELECAHQIIKNALNITTVEQKIEWGEKNESDGVAGEGITRENERMAVINRVKGGS